MELAQRVSGCRLENAGNSFSNTTSHSLMKCTDWQGKHAIGQKSAGNCKKSLKSQESLYHLETQATLIEAGDPSSSSGQDDCGKNLDCLDFLNTLLAM